MDMANTDRTLLKTIAKKNEAKKYKAPPEPQPRKAKFSKFLTQISDRP